MRVRVKDSKDIWGSYCSSYTVTVVPAVPSNFHCTNPTSWGDYPQFSWNESAGATSYYIYRKDPGEDYTLIGSTGSTSYTDNDVSLENIEGYDTFYYKVRAHNSAGTSGYSNEVSITAIAFEKRSISVLYEFSLSQNFPNPFNPVTKICYSLPVTSNVSLIVYNVMGQEVARLVDGQKSAGYHTVKWDARNLTSGIYFYRITAGSYTDMKKMLLLK